jgi:competence protein ComEA
MKNTVRNFLSLSSAERKGVIALMVIIVLLVGIQAYVYFFESAKPIEIQHLVGDIPQKPGPQIAQDDQEIDYREELLQESGFEPMPFDPNEISATEMKQLGMSSKLISTMINYRKKGGKFYRKEDLRKIYGMNEAMYQRLVPFITIKNILPAPLNRSLVHEMTTNRVLDINHADTLVFENQRGIGPVLSRRIIRYRTLLGGFYDTRQLGEVFGLTDSVVMQLSLHFFADTAAISRLNVNEASEWELARHPYIGKHMARGIIMYRSKVQFIKRTEELLVNGLISEEDFRRLRYYLGV